MKPPVPFVWKRLLTITCLLFCLLLPALFLGLCAGSSGIQFMAVYDALTGSGNTDSILHDIVWRIRFPRVMLALLVGSTLSLGGLVFQALLRNPLAEPYILGISGGSAIGAIIGILAGLSRFPGVSLAAFAGSISTLLVILFVTSGQSMIKKDILLLSGVMVNAFCSAVIMFLVSITQDARLHSIIFWLMGDLSMSETGQVWILLLMLFPCFILLFLLSHSMNLLLLGREIAQTTGINIKGVTLALLITTSFMVSATVSYCGLIGFVGLVVPHFLRLLLGPDHRILVPACVLGGGAYLVLCDMMARVLPEQGEMPVGIITAMVGAPLFIYLLKRSKSR
ncbi:MAG TPA: iron ABC transporter permease [Deltaproteobacteria bacterium]|nr:iron ABC transporter permease [Deltaproteobacteria bacterium]